MERMVLLMEASTVEDQKPTFDALFQDTKRAISNRDVEFLVSITDFEGPNAGLTPEKADIYFSGIVDSITSVNTSLTEYKQPRLSKSDEDEFGYTYFLKAANPGCQVKIEINFVSSRDVEESEPNLLNIWIVSEKGECPELTSAKGA